MATHSSVLAWEIPRTEEPDGLQPTGLQRQRQIDNVTAPQVVWVMYAEAARRLHAGPGTLLRGENRDEATPRPTVRPGVLGRLLGCSGEKWTSLDFPEHKPSEAYLQ